MKIYTKTGDKGETGLWGGDRVPKHHPRVIAYGDVDELNSHVGAVLALLPQDKTFASLRRDLERIQEELFMVGALLATPPARLSKLSAPFDKGLPAEAANRLEKSIDAFTAELAPMTKFIMPGGSAAGAALHVARAVGRRAEREATHLASLESVPEGLIVYLNRLSDYLFTAARWVNAKQGKAETPWQGLAHQ